MGAEWLRLFVICRFHGLFVECSAQENDYDRDFRGHEADRLIFKLSVTIAADKNLIDPVVQGIMHMITDMHCAVDKEHAIEMALTEALANAVVHGAQGDTSKLIECDLASDEERGMLIVVRDPGKGFDPEAIPNPIFGQNLLSNHGRGIYLINQLMDEVKFLKNGTEIHMIKR